MLGLLARVTEPLNLDLAYKPTQPATYAYDLHGYPSRGVGNTS
jgi:hypothetical protein